MTPVIIVSNGHTLTETPSYTASTTSSEPAIKPIATVVNGTGTFLIWQGGESTIYPQITLSQYTLVAFVPLLLAVVYTIPFRILDRTICEMEPFYQLHQPGGALAEHSLCLDYMTSNGFITPFKAGMRRHGYMFWSSLMSLAVVGLAPLSSEALFVSLSGAPGYVRGGYHGAFAGLCELGRLPCPGASDRGTSFFRRNIDRVHDLGWSEKRFGCLRRTVELFHSSPLLRGFREVDSMTTNSELKKILAGQRYRIGEFVTAEYRACYGLLPAESESGFIINAHASRKGPYRLVEGAESREKIGSSITSSENRKQKSQRWEMIKEKLLHLGILILVTGLLTLICYYHWSEGDIHHGFEHFMDSGDFGVRFMMTALGVALQMFWSNLDQGLSLFFFLGFLRLPRAHRHLR